MSISFWIKILNLSTFSFPKIFFWMLTIYIYALQIKRRKVCGNYSMWKSSNFFKMPFQSRTQRSFYESPTNDNLNGIVVVSFFGHVAFPPSDEFKQYTTTLFIPVSDK